MAPPPAFQHPSEEQLNLIALKCIEEVNIDKRIIEEVLKTQVLPKTNRKYKKYLECSYKKQGFLSLDGRRMLYDNLFSFLSEFYKVEDLGVLEHCKMIRVDDPAELCFRNLDCILVSLNLIEADDDEVDTNNV
ncbi:uncharacterized protein LOC115890652 [Sitophilus oryzae]|uniref:Uncharacterized protein LOC115890652 n=1 Tax=Sitophilus oryzae TaxID=7048 RepID=A0A6J2YU40_SITOR|nr:uncharacterized protein LOC115890652 [Sitophilus oryzae]